MRFVADSSLLVRLYLHDSKSESIERFLAHGAKVVSLSDLARVEVINVLLRHQDRADQFLTDLEEGLRLRLEPVDWSRAFRQAESLARALKTLLDDSALTRVTALLLADGGAAALNPPQWIEKLRPQVVLLSVAGGDQEGHPDPEIFIFD